MNNTLITIITVSYNSVSSIEETILSVISQTYKNIEYIIIDGGSTDGTVDIIKKYQDRISYWISEPDRGIFDAMNKGVEKATGKWINFMNCGDSFYSINTIQEFVKLASIDNGVIYGDVNVVKGKNEYLNKSSDIEKITRNLPFCHQSSFTSTVILKEKKFNLNFKLCADYNFFYTLYKENKKFQQIPLTIANFEAQTGVSSTNISQLKKEIQAITGRNKWSVDFEYAMRNLKNVILKWGKIKV